MIEYFKNQEATEKFFYTDINGDKWSLTGDIGYINEDGSLVVLGRKSDFSIINGNKFYNFDIERAILQSNTVKLCEIQTHPDDDNRLVAHIVWENEINSLLKKNPEKQEEYLSELQKVVLKAMKSSDAVPYSFCVRDGFPSAQSGKRDIKFVKNDIDNLIEVNKPQIKKLVK